VPRGWGARWAADTDPRETPLPEAVDEREPRIAEAEAALQRLDAATAGAAAPGQDGTQHSTAFPDPAPIKTRPANHAFPPTPTGPQPSDIDHDLQGDEHPAITSGEGEREPEDSPTAPPDPTARSEDHGSPARGWAQRVEQTELPEHTQRWQELCTFVDPRLPDDPHYPALAAAMTRAHAGGANLADLLPTLAHDLNPAHPGRDLHARLIVAADAARTPSTPHPGGTGQRLAVAMAPMAPMAPASSMVVPPAGRPR
jgi:hypothetical protein